MLIINNMTINDVTNAVFHWQIFATNLSKSVNSIGGFLNGPIEITDFCRFVAKVCQWKTALN